MNDAGQVVEWPFTERASTVLAYAIEEARSMGHELVGTQHVLLGLLREGEGIAMAVMRGLGADLDLENARAITRRLMGVPEPDPANAPPVQP